MAVDPLFTCLAPHTVTITPTTSFNNYDEVSVEGTVRTAKAYVEPPISIRGTDQITEEARSVRAYIFDTAITTTDVITLPDGTTPDIANVAVYDFIEGMEHTVVTFV